MKVLGWITFVVGLLVFSALWKGFVLSVLWGWFIVPLFHAPALNIAFAIGLSIVVGMFTTTETSSDDKKEAAEKLIAAGLYAFLFPLFALIMGAIVHAFI